MTTAEAWHVSSRYQPGEIGKARIDRHTANETEAMIGRLHGESISVGDTVVRLFVGGQLVMSDSYDELRGHYTAIRMARGKVLVNGLGLGCYLWAILQKPEVESVDVVELSADVVSLVGPYFSPDHRVHIICANAFEQSTRWPKGTRWNCAWHDIWASKCTDDLEEHSKLLRSYGKRVDWQGCWAHEQLQLRKRQGY